MVILTGLLVAGCGGLAAVLRFLVDQAVQSRRPPRSEFPLGTLAVNASGTVLLGLIVGAGAKGQTMLLVGTAVLGSYTTFSTWMLESHRPAQDGESRLAWGNVAVGLALGLGAIAAGKALGHLL
jgi:fluoride exporter